MHQGSQLQEQANNPQHWGWLASAVTQENAAHQEFLFEGRDPCLCDIEQVTRELPQVKKLSTRHLEYGIAKQLFCNSPPKFITTENLPADIIYLYTQQIQHRTSYRRKMGYPSAWFFLETSLPLCTWQTSPLGLKNTYNLIKETLTWIRPFLHI